MFPPRSLFFLLLAGPLLGVGQAALQASATRPGDPDASPDSALAELRSAATRAERLARDDRLLFTAGSARRARADLDAGITRAEERASALFALGCAHSVPDLLRLESSATAGLLTERAAAILSLGELGQRGFGALARVLDTELIGLENLYTFALVRSAQLGSSRAIGLLDELARGPAGPLASAARTMAPLAHGAELPHALAALDRYHELRWRSARDYGFVDGRRWRELVLEELLDDEEFLDRVVVLGASRLSSPAVLDHVAEMISGGRRLGALRAAARSLPDGIARAVQAGSWLPADLVEWHVILREIDHERVERRAIPFLQAAFEEDEALAVLAGELLLRAGEPPMDWIEARLVGAPAPERQALVAAAADSRDPSWILRLTEVRARQPGPRDQAVVLVALARLGDPAARKEILEKLAGESASPLHELFMALGRSGHDPLAGPWIGTALMRDDLTWEEYLTLRLARSSVADEEKRAELRAFISSKAGTRRLRMRAVRLLAPVAGEEELFTFRERFPAEEDVDLNVELVLALLRHRDQAAIQVLQRAVWSAGWNRSILAAGLLIQMVGEYEVIDALDAPPAGATDEDRRRLGFALGQWGGLPLLDVLVRGRGETDPALQGALLGALTTRSH